MAACCARAATIIVSRKRRFSETALVRCSCTGRPLRIALPPKLAGALPPIRSVQQHKTARSGQPLHRSRSQNHQLKLLSSINTIFSLRIASALVNEWLRSAAVRQSAGGTNSVGRALTAHMSSIRTSDAAEAALLDLAGAPGGNAMQLYYRTVRAPVMQIGCIIECSPPSCRRRRRQHGRRRRRRCRRRRCCMPPPPPSFLRHHRPCQQLCSRCSDRRAASLVHWQWGNPEGCPVLFVHGGPGNSVADYDQMAGGGVGAANARFFDPSIWFVVEVDQRGTGKSQPSVRDDVANMAEYMDITIAVMSSDFEAVREHLGIERWLVFGGSWGSTLGLSLIHI